MNLYIVVDCQTPNCGTTHVLRHLGEKGATPSKVEYWMSYPLIIECPSCGWSYDYSNSETQFRQAELPAPPPGHLDRLAPPSFSKGSKNRSDEEN